MWGKKTLFFLLFLPDMRHLSAIALWTHLFFPNCSQRDVHCTRISQSALTHSCSRTPISLARTRRANLWPMIDVTCASVCFPLSQRCHIYFPLYRPAALCWYRAEIWTGVTRAIFLHGLRQWLAKTQQLSSVWKLKYGPEQLTKVFVGDPKELFIFQAQML